MKYYIAGPMTGYPDFNWEAFEEAEHELIGWGNECTNPHKVGFTPFDVRGMQGDEPLEDYQLHHIITDDLEALLSCDAIYLLRGWERSVGARAEHAVAIWRGILIEYQV